MAIYHLSIKAIARSAGRSATAAAAYRAAEKIEDKRTGEVHDYTQKRGVEYSELYLPGGQTADRAEFWNRLEAHHKRGDAVLSREVEVALPAELSAEQRQKLTTEFVLGLVDRYGVAADVAIHQPSKRGDTRNHHAHILLSACHVAPDGTLGKKAVLLDPIHCQRHQLENVADRERMRWAELVNAALERQGQEARVDHRTLAAQSIDREPGRHLGPAATGYERRRGQPSRRRQDAEHEERERPRESERPKEPTAPPLDLAKEQAALREEVERRRALAQERKAEKEPVSKAAPARPVMSQDRPEWPPKPAQAQEEKRAQEPQRPQAPVAPRDLAQEQAKLREEITRRRALAQEPGRPTPKPERGRACAAGQGARADPKPKETT